jgi:2,4-dienoyl-CoA reductase-like NADH-dependent reductase (Old Yellow Enzyme family)
MNQREDQYGGPPEARVRYPAEVVAAVADAVPEEFVVGIRVSQTMVTDTDHQWAEGEDAAAVFFEELSAAGAEYIHTTEPDATAPTFGADGPTLGEAAVEHATDDTVVIANGGLGAPEAARTALDGGADFLTLATGALANPDWPSRVAQGVELAEFDYREFLRPAATISEHELELGPSLSDD